MVTQTEQVIQSRAGGRVERCHTFTKFGSYTVAEHSWGVALLIWYLYGEEDYNRLSIYALTHDIPEAWVGDIPSPVKRYVPGVGKQLEEAEKKLNERLGLPFETDLDPEDYRKLKSCDQLEFFLWCHEQINLGNRYIEEQMEQIMAFLDEADLPAPARKLYESVKNEEESFTLFKDVLKSVL